MIEAKKAGRPYKSQEIVYDLQQIKVDFISGKTQGEISRQYGVSRERIRQILTKMGLSRVDGGKHIKTESYRRAKTEKMNASIKARLDRWGFTSIEEFYDHVVVYGSSSKSSSPMRKFMDHRSNALKAGWMWEISFVEWWKMWEQSGRWDDRGRGKYAMRLIDETKPFAVGNVEIFQILGTPKKRYKKIIKATGTTMLDDYLNELKRA